MVFSLNTASDIFIKLALHSFQRCTTMSRLLQKVAFTNGMIIFKSLNLYSYLYNNIPYIQYMVSCKLYMYIYVCTITDVHEGIGMNLT